MNCFYLINGFLQFIPQVQTNSPAATFLPLLFVIVMGIIKEGIVDFKRHKSDNETNNRICQRYNRNSNSFVTVRWKDI